MKRSQIIVGASLLAITIIALFVWYKSAGPRPRPLPKNIPQLQEPRPIYDWFVCGNLGIGPVPGVSEPRLRFQVCHNEGWAVLAYCLQPNWPAPEVGAACALIDDNTFWCGEGIQNLSEYAILQTPAPTPTPFVTPTNTPSPTITPTASATPILATETPGTPLPSGTTTPFAATATSTPSTPAATTPVVIATQRPSPGGMGIVEWLVSRVLRSHATPTPFQPQPYTATPLTPEQEVNPDLPPSANFYGIDFNDPSARIRIKIFPPNKRVNGGKAIVISFRPGQTCVFGDRQACVNSYSTEEGGQVTYITAHSGIGGEAEAFRRAMEGMGFDQASYSLRQVQARLHELEGAEVEIVQGDKVVDGLMLAGAVRVPPRRMAEYFDLALPDALSLAASINPALASSLKPGKPQVVFETCGWKMPAEPWLPGITSTNASIYLGVIQKRP